MLEAKRDVVAVGPSVFGRDGERVGCGRAEGAAVNPGDGVDEGAGDGLAVGRLVGPAVGATEGAALGAAVGAAEGVAVGGGVEAAEGARVGLRVGGRPLGLDDGFLPLPLCHCRAFAPP